MSDTTVVRISRRAGPWFEEAFRTQGLGERICWDATFGPGQDQQTGQMVPVFMMYAEMPAAQLGRVHYQFAQLGAAGLAQEAVNEAVRQILARLHESRRAELSMTNGHGPTGGLVVPGA